MDGIHDMGGMDGFGSVVVEPNEAVFHQRWESRVLAMNRAMGASGTWNIDVAHYRIELLQPQVYLTSSYYERWFLRLERLIVQHGLVDTDEIAAGHALRPGRSVKRGTFTRLMLTSFSGVARSGGQHRPRRGSRFVTECA